MNRAVVVGAGVGGLTTAAELARAGLDVTVLEAHIYPGGCAGTFYHQGYRLHLRVATTTQILGLVREGKNGPTYSFNLVNAAGHVFCRFYARTPATQHSFEHFCRTWHGPITEHAPRRRLPTRLTLLHRSRSTNHDPNRHLVDPARPAPERQRRARCRLESG